MGEILVTSGLTKVFSRRVRTPGVAGFFASLTLWAVVAHSLAFWLGSAEALAAQLLNALVTFSTYPTVIFRGGVKLVLFTVIPAGFIAYLPVEALRSLDAKLLGAVVGFAALAVATSVLIFRRGMRRYESGNLLAFRD